MACGRAYFIDLQHGFRHLLHGLPHTKIGQDLLGTSEDSIEFVDAVELLHDTSHAGLRDTPTTKDIHGIVGDLVRTSGGIALQEANRSTQKFTLLGITHITHLIGDAFDPALTRLGHTDHLGQFLADDGLCDERLAEHDALVRPLEAFLDDGAHPADHLARNGPPFVVEVAHDDDEAVVFLAQEVVHGNLDVFELNKRRTRGCRIGCLDALGLDVVVARYNDDTDSLFCLARCDKIVGEHAVGDPFLGSYRISSQPSLPSRPPSLAGRPSQVA